jgi:glucose-6-phosphate isomerase
MINYSFPINLGPTELNFGTETNFLEMNERKLSDLKPVLYKNQGLDFDCTIYKMYRGVIKLADKEIFKDIRHDITTMPPGILNGEFVKTYGHYHPKLKNLSYPEIYQVVNGKAVFLLQDDPDNLKNVKLIFSQSKEIVIIPPNIGHVTINIGKDNLILANLVFGQFESLYEPFERKHGAGYYILEGNPVQWLPNTFYSNLPTAQVGRPLNPWNNQFIYDLFKNNPPSFQFLAEPQHFNFTEPEIFQETPVIEIFKDLEI